MHPYLRWLRAASLGLDPPREILDLLDRLGPEHPLQKGIWEKRI